MAADPRPASAVVLWRDAGSKGSTSQPAHEGPEVFWVQRGAALRFSGGFWAFPGGRVDEHDAHVPVSSELSPEDRILVASAARELFEETGVLVVAGDLPGVEARRRWREALLAGDARFGTLLSEGGLEVAGDRFVPAGRWITPPMMPIRFDARFFLVRCPPREEPEVWPGELASGAWVRPADGRALWERGERLLHPPAQHVLETLARGDEESWPARLAAPPHVVDHVAKRIEFQGGVLLEPLRTPTLPPATHTNTVVVGDADCVVIDPGSPYDEEHRTLVAQVRGLEADGRHVREIWLTHHHRDHASGAAALARELGVPVAAHPRTAELVQDMVVVDRPIEDGEVRVLGNLSLRAVFTPGHSPGHLCFFEERSRALFAGDMVAGVGTVIVDPPLGDMGDYMASLAKLQALGARVIYPGHGPVLADEPAKLAEYVAHRGERQAQVLRALSASPRTAEEMVPACYTDIAPAMYPLAARSLTAILLKLEREGRAVREAGSKERWRTP